MLPNSIISKVICDTGSQLPNAVLSYAGILFQYHFDNTDQVCFEGIACIISDRLVGQTAGPLAPC